MPLASNANEPSICLERGFASSGDQPVGCEAACCHARVQLAQVACGYHDPMELRYPTQVCTVVQGLVIKATYVKLGLKPNRICALTASEPWYRKEKQASRSRLSLESARPGSEALAKGIVIRNGRDDHPWYRLGKRANRARSGVAGFARGCSRCRRRLYDSSGQGKGVRHAADPLR